MKRKKKVDSTTKVVLAVVITAIIVIAIYLSGILPSDFSLAAYQEDEAQTPGDELGSSDDIELTLSDFEIFSLLEILFGKSLSYSEIQPYITSLHMKVYGKNGVDAPTLLQWFEAEYASEGWASYGTSTQVSTGWVAYHEIWTRTTNARSASIAEGAAVTAALGYETVYILAYGPATTYWQFYNTVK